jgi:imidazolonepropionase-like amidohydrolase
MAISYGLPVDEGLKAVTLYPAQILGVALGTIEAGKRASGDEIAVVHRPYR